MKNYIAFSARAQIINDNNMTTWSHTIVLSQISNYFIITYFSCIIVVRTTAVNCIWYYVPRIVVDKLFHRSHVASSPSVAGYLHHFCLPRPFAPLRASVRASARARKSEKPPHVAVARPALLSSIIYLRFIISL